MLHEKAVEYQWTRVELLRTVGRISFGASKADLVVSRECDMSKIFPLEDREILGPKQDQSLLDKLGRLLNLSCQV